MRAVWPGTFRTETVDNFAGVLIPLDQAHLHSHSARSGRTEFEEPPDDGTGGTGGGADGYEDDDEEVGKDAENEGTGMLEMRACEYSIEGLRREVRRGGEGQWTDYESRFLSGGGERRR